MAEKIKGNLTFDEFQIIPPRMQEVDDIKLSGFNLLISGEIDKTTLKPKGEMFVVGVAIDYLSYDASGRLVDNSDLLRQASIRQITVIGIGGKPLALPIDTSTPGYRVDRGRYIVFRTIPTLIEKMPNIVHGEDGPHVDWDNVPSIHFDYTCENQAPGSVAVEPAFEVRFSYDEYNIILNNVMEPRTNTYVRNVENGDWIDRENPANRTGSVNLDYFTDLGIGKSRFVGTESWGNYKVSSSREYSYCVGREMREQLRTKAAAVDPAFQPYVGFSGSIVRSGSMQEDIEAGTATFEELKFTKFRTTPSLMWFVEPWDGADIERVKDEKGLLPREVDNYLPEIKDIIYQAVSSSYGYRRVTNGYIYNADSNKIYTTDDSGIVIRIDSYVRR